MMISKIAIAAGHWLCRVSRVCVELASVLYGAGYGPAYHKAPRVAAVVDAADLTRRYCRPRAAAEHPVSIATEPASAAVITAADIDLAYVRASARLAGWDGGAGDMLLSRGVAPLAAAELFRLAHA